MDLVDISDVESVLGQVALQASHPENVATEALAYILRKSERARAALGQYFVSMGAAATPDLDYQTQAAVDEEGTPDLVGHDAQGEVRVVLEAKFWAGLTAHQPVSYLARLARDSVLAFVVPSRRVDLLWGELLTRLRAANVACIERASTGPYRAAALADGKHVLLFNWGSMLAVLQDRLLLDGDQARTEDVRQLQGLCVGMAEAGFPPLGDSELTSGLWRRIAHLANLVPAVVTLLEERGVASSAGSRVSSGPGWTSQKIRIRGFDVHLTFDTDACGRFLPTPFWLQLPAAARQHVTALALERPPRLIAHPWGGYPYVALRTPVGVERDEVISALARECEAIAAMFPMPAGVPVPGGQVPPPAPAANVGAAPPAPVSLGSVGPLLAPSPRVPSVDGDGVVPDACRSRCGDRDLETPLQQRPTALFPRLPNAE